jgi:hypothetical protein
VREGAFSRAMGFVGGVLFEEGGASASASVSAGEGGVQKWKGERKERAEGEWAHFGKELPRAC